MRKVLVIDDEKPTLSMFTLILEVFGYAALTAESGEQGLQIFERERPPIVLTDIKMPGMDGLEVLGRIKRTSPRTEVIVITGHGDIDLALAALNLNATDFIDKPIRQEALAQALARAEERLAFALAQNDQIALTRQGGTAVLTIRGTINSQTESFLTEAYRQASDEGRTPLVLRFDKSASVNGAGIAVLAGLLADSAARGQKVAIAGPSENFRAVFETVGITKSARIYDTLDQALAAIR
jgi:anti-anti-sigma factor